jgi:surface polysaccharide O-acyltransferase-like enzyme
MKQAFETELGAAGPDPVDTMRFLAIFFMMYAHYGLSTLPGASVSVLAHEAYMIFHGGLSRASAPFLGVVSGYFVCRALARRPYAALVRNRASTLLLPTVFWSVCFILFDLLRSLAAGAPGRFEKTYFESLYRFVNYVLPISNLPANAPLHYLSDLFKMCLIAPLLIWIVTRLSLKQGLVLCLAVALAQFTESPANETNILPRWDLATFFLVGVVIANKGVDLKALMLRPAPIWLVIPSLAVVIVGASLWEPLLKSDRFIDDYAGYLLIMLIKCAGIVVFIYAAQWIVHHPTVHPWIPDRRHVFRAFCVHIFFVVLLKQASQTQMGASWREFSYYGAFFALPLVVFASVYLADLFLVRFLMAKTSER